MSKDIYDMRKTNAPLEKIIITMECVKGKLLPDRDVTTFLRVTSEGQYNVPKGAIDNFAPSAAFNLVPDMDEMSLIIFREAGLQNIVIDIKARFEEEEVLVK